MPDIETIKEKLARIEQLNAESAKAQELRTRIRFGAKVEAVPDPKGEVPFWLRVFGGRSNFVEYKDEKFVFTQIEADLFSDFLRQRDEEARKQVAILTAELTREPRTGR